MVFQFLMVRLKVTSPYLSGTSAIAFQFLMVRLKVETKKAILLIGSAFQFLMVRLKATAHLGCVALSVISIPYGAIKSHFLYIKKYRCIYFNSLWCD